MVEKNRHGKFKAQATCALFITLSIGLSVSTVAAKAQESSSSPKKFATAVARLKSKPIPVYSNIALEKVRLSDNIVTPPGFPLGGLEFIIQPGEAVDLVDIFPNDGESGYTLKVQNRAGESGFILDGPLEVTEWIGDRGELLRILTGQPYEYEGDYSASCHNRTDHIKELEGFISKHASSKYTAFAELAILGTTCDSIPDTLQEVWNKLRILKEGGAIGSRGTKVKTWTPEVNRLYSTLAKRESARLQELFDFCDLVVKLQESVPSPVGSLEAASRSVSSHLERTTTEAPPASRATAAGARVSASHLAEVLKAAEARELVGEAGDGGRIWPMRVQISHYDPASGTVSGRVKWPTLQATHRIEGRVDGNELIFEEVDYIERGSAILGCVYTLKATSSSSLEGTYSVCASGGFANLELQ